ncbi:gastrula zinc finger protein XlCGF57.1-like [Thalassophryne amazonica]|uniref:gastrula zinc finger protein XlCGF57.1-like n=1 Tax=Thalassophryne amazonica TaxID=390379 RepID=UPI001470A50E|nr:gastrula zinc finger protein XlCGF57.1-like [Thalassophryne amazonica]
MTTEPPQVGQLVNCQTKFQRHKYRIQANTEIKNLASTTGMQELSVRKEDILPEQQEWNLSPPQEDPKLPNIKEEGQKLWPSQEEEQLHQLEQADFTKLLFTVVPVKIENEDEKPHSSQLCQSQTDDHTEAEPVASNTTEHITLRIKADVEDCGGLQPASYSNPCHHLQPATDGRSSGCSETETDDSYEWKQSKEPHSDFNCLKTGHVSVSDDPCAIVKKQFNCSVCQKIFCQPNIFRQNKTTQASEKPITCLECGRRQRQVVHLNTQMGRQREEKPFGCLECGKSYTEKRSLKRHMRIHTEEKPFVCADCGRRFTEKGSLNRHMRIHTGEKPFGCTDCGKRFRENRNLSNHMKIHTGEKPFSCSNCGEKFREKCILKTHMAIHTGEKPFGCLECGKTFTERRNLRSHMRSHTRDKPFDCSDCGKRFRHKSNLKTHMSIHTGQKPFGCSYCGKIFRQKGNLISHMNLHTGEKPFVCSYCGKRFGHKGNLITHMSTHTGERPFGCSYCGKRFGKRSNLNIHKIIHTEEKPFSCSYCGKTFRQKSVLNTHLRGPLHSVKKKLKSF